MQLDSIRVLKAYAIDTVGNVGPVITNEYLIGNAITLTKNFDNGSGGSTSWYFVSIYLNGNLVSADYADPDFPYTFFAAYGSWSNELSIGFGYRFQIVVPWNTFTLTITKKSTGEVFTQIVNLDTI